jgi:hypothetical protein
LSAGVRFEHAGAPWHDSPMASAAEPTRLRDLARLAARDPAGNLLRVQERR